MIQTTPGFELAASFGTADALLEALPSDGADWSVVLMDIEMPGTTGIDATRRLKQTHPALPVIVVTVFEEPATILDAICSGADGYLLKRTPIDELLEDIEVVCQGGSPLTPGIARTVLSLMRQAAPKAAPASQLDLTEREQEVLRGLVEGKTYREVAQTLFISIDTVRTHIRSLYKKLQVHNVAAAVRRAVREGLV